MPSVNNAFYDDLGTTWHEGDGHAIALLRAEGRAKVAYTREVFAREGVPHGGDVLDVACGGGLVARPLSESGYRVTGIDLSASSVEMAKRWDPRGTFDVGDAAALPYADGSFDAVLLLDMLEHVEDLGGVLREAGRVLRPGGVVVFNTFNRTPAAAAVAIYGFHVVVRDTPEHIHVYDLFRTPAELGAAMAEHGLQLVETRGLRPRLDGAFWRSVARRRVDPAFSFRETRSTAVGYLGYAKKPA